MQDQLTEIKRANLHVPISHIPLLMSLYTKDVLSSALCSRSQTSHRKSSI